MSFKTACAVLIRTQISSFNGFSRAFSDARKKFYKNVSITCDENRFEINLDERKLRTPSGKILQLPNRPLALMVAQEWNSQQKTIQLHDMHLTSLANTSQDNPLRLKKQQMIDLMLEHLSSDTICFRINEPQELYEFQSQKWDPLLEWFERTFQCSLPTTKGVFLDNVPKLTQDTIGRYLSSHDQSSLFGFQFILDNLKSIVISLALVHKHLTVTEAVSLSRLEQEFQIQRWGSVEWAHDTDLMLLRSRVAAGLLHFILNHESTFEQQGKVRQS